MKFVILRLLRHNELGVFHAYRRQGKEVAKQRAINFDGDVVDRVFPAAKDTDSIALSLDYETDKGVGNKSQSLKRQHKNWRLEGNCPTDHIYDFVDPGCLFAMVVDAGVRPGVGAWGVYPADHPVTLAITGSAESSSLTSHSMIALHGAEGRRTLALLQESKPALFGPTAPQVAERKPDAKPERSSAGVYLEPHPRRTADLLASVGHSLASAVADIVDNAISADATEIRITFSRPDDGHGRWMSITDNGTGMDQARLEEAMRIGSEAKYETGDLGKYGYGLKGASWSQSPSFTVITKQAGKEAIHLAWDTEHMESWHAQDAPLEPWVQDITRIKDQGTCVFWPGMRPPKAMPYAKGVEPHTAEIQELHRHLGLVFHRFLEGKATGRKKVRITIGVTPVEPNNPVGHALTKSYDRKRVRVPGAAGDAFVEVQAYVLPSESEIKNLHRQDPEAARRDLERIGMYGRRNESQGVYAYRNQRLIQWGGWHQMWATSDEKTKLARITVDFGTELDDRFDVNISKRMVTLGQQLQEEIKKLADPARKDSKRKYLDTERPKTSKPGRTTPPGVDPPTGAPAGPLALPGSASAPPAPAKPAVPVRPVRTSSFLWKIGRTMTGGKEIQISDHDVDLHKLYLAVAKDATALASLADFLERLDEAGVQKVLLDQKRGP